MVFPITRVAVAGRSMLPALAPGDFLLVWRWPRPRPRVGALVVVDLPDRPLGVKRLVRWTADGAAWVEGDNPLESTDSRVFGPVAAQALRGRVLCRYWPLVRSRR
jgi:nickel-type superoxide dismutase maturation protease